MTTTQIAKYWVSFTKDERLPEAVRGTVIYRGNNKREALKAKKAAERRYAVDGHWYFVTDSFQARGPF